MAHLVRKEGLMEHIVQFGITIDDSVIANRAVEIASKQLAADLRSQIFNMGSYIYSGSPDIKGLSPKAEELVKELLTEHKDEIITLAVEQVVESIKRSKGYREAVNSLKEKTE